MSPIGAALLLAAAVGGTTAGGFEAPGELLRLPVRRAGDPVRPLDSLLHGARAVVTLWATYCPPCRAEVPTLRHVARRWGRSGVRVIGIAIDIEEPAELARASAKWGIDYETYWVPPDARDRAAALAPAGLPVTFFVGPDGVSRYDRLLVDADVDTLIPRRLGIPPLPGPGDG